MQEIIFKWPGFEKLPINCFKLPKLNLSFRGNISERRDQELERYVGYEVDIDDDELFYRYLHAFQSKDNPFLYLTLGDLSYDVLQQGGCGGGSLEINVAIARIQNIPEVVDVRQRDQLERSVQFLFDQESDGEMHGPNFEWVSINGLNYLREDGTHERSNPNYIFYLPINQRHALAVSFDFLGFVPIDESLPTELYAALMSGAESFLSYIQIEDAND